jgi:AcrR family transcriptional regulator
MLIVMSTARSDKQAKITSQTAAGSRRRILDAARRVFACRGYEGASIGEIASEAGFSKGALYWNFAGKEELFFALLDELDEQLRVLISSSTAPSTEQETTEQLSHDLAGILAGARDVVLLFHEYSALAVRDPAVAARYAKRNSQLRSELASTLADHYADHGLSLTIAPEHIATMLIALVDGLSIQQITEPDAVPVDLFGQILCLIDDGLAAKAKEQT